jgi:hypothetical protein
MTLDMIADSDSGEAFSDILIEGISSVPGAQV